MKVVVVLIALAVAASAYPTQYYGKFKKYIVLILPPVGSSYVER